MPQYAKYVPISEWCLDAHVGCLNLDLWWSHQQTPCCNTGFAAWPAPRRTFWAASTQLTLGEISGAESTNDRLVQWKSNGIRSHSQIYDEWVVTINFMGGLWHCFPNILGSHQLSPAYGISFWTIQGVNSSRPPPTAAVGHSLGAGVCSRWTILGERRPTLCAKGLAGGPTKPPGQLE